MNSFNRLICFVAMTFLFFACTMKTTVSQAEKPKSYSYEDIWKAYESALEAGSKEDARRISEIFKSTYQISKHQIDPDFMSRIEMEIEMIDFEMTPLEWSADIYPGMTESELIDYLESLGVTGIYSKRGGFTYTSQVCTTRRDYFFCNDHLYAIIEGGYYSGRDFNEWLQTYLSAYERYGEPKKYEVSKEWGQFVTVWVLGDNDKLFFVLSSDLKKQQGWNRQLLNIEYGSPCIDRD